MDEEVTHAPAGALAASVPRFVAYRSEGLTPGSHVGLPSSTMTLVLALDEGLDVTLGGTRGTYDAMLSGLHTTPATIRYGTAQVGIQLAIDPLASRGLFGMPAAELAHSVVDLDAVWGRLGEQVLDAAGSADSLRQACRAVESSISLAGNPGVRREVAGAWQLIMNARGQISVDVISEAVGWSRRHLEQEFRHEFGVSPKQACRLRRFERSVELVRAHHDLAESAAIAGFSDQSHLNRDWRALAGTSPTRWRRNENLAFIQDSARALADSHLHD
ncbi:AraC family transcriptional regulator [Cumulibacter soli]|uniref:AraC family transcriptional regulator n=1 Tax=Cumulibacter soli TaxID=2546344 RepID=UPI00106778BA|nr:helix-turn-helix domain-containing protein [Cumulibacter soli]